MEFNIFHLQRAALSAILFYISNIFEWITSGSCVGGENIPFIGITKQSKHQEKLFLQY